MPRCNLMFITLPHQPRLLTQKLLSCHRYQTTEIVQPSKHHLINSITHAASMQKARTASSFFHSPSSQHTTPSQRRPPLFPFNGLSPFPLLQNTQTNTLGSHSSFNPTQPMCNHLKQASHCTMSVSASSTKPSHTHLVLSLLLLLHSVDGVVVVVGEPLKELE